MVHLHIQSHIHTVQGQQTLFKCSKKTNLDKNMSKDCFRKYALDIRRLTLANLSIFCIVLLCCCFLAHVWHGRQTNSKFLSKHHLLIMRLNVGVYRCRHLSHSRVSSGPHICNYICVSICISLYLYLYLLYLYLYFLHLYLYFFVFVAVFFVFVSAVLLYLYLYLFCIWKHLQCSSLSFRCCRYYITNMKST